MTHPLRKWREAHGETLRAFARRSGVSYGSISRIENDHQQASEEAARKISGATGGAISIKQIRTRQHEPRVYFVEAGENGPIKVGVVYADMRQRMNEIQICCPQPIRILGTTPGGYGLEAAIKHELRAYRIHGEWFERHPFVEQFIGQLFHKDTIFQGVRVGEVHQRINKRKDRAA